MSVNIAIDRIDHFVLTVADVDRTCDFYEQALGMRREDFEPRPGDVRSALCFGRNKINLHPYPSPYDPKGRNPVKGAGDFCLITETPIEQVVAHLDELGIEIEVEPSKRTGATGELRSIYFRDLDGNLVEVSNYLQVASRASPRSVLRARLPDVDRPECPGGAVREPTRGPRADSSDSINPLRWLLASVDEVAR